MREDRLITLPSFLEAFVRQHADRPDRPFCFVLGAGASCASGIPDAAAMAHEFLRILHRADDFEGLPVERWATAERLGLDGFTWAQAGRYYAELYERCFREHEEDGTAFLEKHLAGKRPGAGYAALAAIVATTPHKVVLTPNFDDLAAEAIAAQADVFPRLVDLDRLAGSPPVGTRRPWIVKVAETPAGGGPRGLDTAAADEASVRALESLFRGYTPVVIGYQGNDGCLPRLLERLSPSTPGTVFWCFHDPDRQPLASLEQVPIRLRDFVRSRKGRLVPIPGFDELLLLLLHRLTEIGVVSRPRDLFRLRERERLRTLTESEQHLVRRYGETAGKEPPAPGVGAGFPSQLDQLLRVAVQALGAGERLSAAEGEAAPAPNVDSGAAAEPPSVWAERARALAREGSHVEAERCFQVALDAEPRNPDVLGDYAVLLTRCGRGAEAEEFFRRALEVAPDHANNLGNYAVALRNSGRSAEAEAYYRRALAADARHAGHLGNLALLLAERGADDEAEALFRRALEADPDRGRHFGNFGRFLWDRGRLDEARTQLERAVTVDPGSARDFLDLARLLFASGAAAEGSQRLAEVEFRLGNDAELALEFHLTRLVHDPRAWDTALPAVQGLLESGMRCADEDGDPDWARGRGIEPPRRAFVDALLRAAAGQTDLSSLDAFPDWRAARSRA